MLVEASHFIETNVFQKKNSYINPTSAAKQKLTRHILEEEEEENEKEYNELNGDDNFDESKYTTASSATAAENDISDVSTYTR